jgi:hypothetical protein
VVMRKTNGRGMIAEAGRLWDAAWALDDLLGDNQATNYVASQVRELNGSSEAVTVLADNLEGRLHEEKAKRDGSANLT